MNDLIWSIIVGAIGSGGLAATLVAIRKAKPEVRDIETQIAERVLKMADSRLVELKEERDNCKNKLIDHEGRIMRLEAQVRGLGKVPVNGP